MNNHITSICRAAYYYLTNIHSLKPFLSKDSLITVVRAFATFRIEYCNLPVITPVTFSEFRNLTIYVKMILHLAFAVN